MSSTSTFECEIRARFRDTNIGGHVDNVEAVRIIDEARIEFFQFAPLAHGTGLLALMPAGVTSLMGAQRIDYNAEMQMRPQDPFHVSIWVSHLGRTSFDVSTALRVAQDGQPALLAVTTMVFFDKDAGASWPMSDDMRAVLSSYLAPVAPLRGTR